MISHAEVLDGHYEKALSNVRPLFLFLIQVLLAVGRSLMI